jgi:uncharacterized membrane protein YhaH (DUF805 family)
MLDFVLGLLFVVLIVTPAIAAPLQRRRWHDSDL